LKDFGTARRCIVSLNNHLKGTDACAGTPELHVPNLIFPVTGGERLELWLTGKIASCLWSGVLRDQFSMAFSIFVCSVLLINVFANHM